MPLADPSTTAAPVATPPPPGRARRISRASARAFGWVAAAYGSVCCALLACSLVLGDGTWAWLYVANLSVIYWLAPAAPLALVALVARRFVGALACAVGACVWLVTFGPLYLPQATPAGNTVRVVSYNISPDRDVDHVASTVARTVPDVLLVQELVPAAQDDLVRLLPSLPYHHFAPVNTSAPGGGGTAVLSRFPIVDSAAVAGLPDTSRPIDVVTLDAGDRTFSVLSLHLASPCASCDGESSAASVETALQQEIEARQREADAVARALPDGPVVVAGDLNSGTFNAPRRRLLAAELVDAHRAVGSGPGFTRQRGPLRFRIDWLFTTPDVTPVRAFVGPQGGSDHRPVVTDVLLPDL